MSIEKHVFAGITFPGRHAVKTIATELQRQKAARKDAITRSDKMELKILDNQMLMDVPIGTERHLVPMSNSTWNQLWGWMGLPKRSGYYNWLMRGTQHMPKNQKDREALNPQAHWDNARTMVNDFLKTQKEHRLVRLMDDEKNNTYMRAMLSDKYKIVSNADFFEAIVDKLLDAKAEIWHARLSEDKFMVYAVAPGLAAQVSTKRSFDPGDGWQSRWYGKEGDVYNAALSAWNSETGEGGYGIAQSILRRVCVNYCVWQDIVAKTHVGRRIGDEQMLSDETIRKENEVFFLKIRDYVDGTFKPETFQKIVDAVNGATKDGIDPKDAEKAAEALQLVYQLPEERMARIKQLFYQDGDYSRHGLANAVTGAAHDATLEPEKGFDMERLGADIMRTSMDKILKKGEKLAAEKEKKEVRQLAGVSAGNDGFDVE